MVLLEGFLSALAYASVIVASLRAGSRAIYLKNHDSIGVMQGPPILGPNDVENITDASPIWDLSFPFQQSIRLALFPDQFDFQESAIAEPSESYSMSPLPLANQRHSKQCLLATQQDIQSSILDQVIAEKQSKNAFIHRLKGEWLRPFVKYPRGLSSQIVFHLKEWVLPWNWRTWKRWFREDLVEIEDLSEEEGEDEDEDFWDYDWKRVARADYSSTSGSNTTAVVTVHAPETFADLRSRFGISEASFQKSMLDSGPYVSFQSNSKGAARVGGVFFFTSDGAYMIKTIKKEEVTAFMKMIPKYHRHMRRNRNSLLTRFCGMYTVAIAEESDGGLFPGPRVREWTLVIMNSVFPAEGSQFISERYDLKGSTVGRECSEGEKEKQGSNAVLKDLDLAKEVALVKSAKRRRARRVAQYGLHLGTTKKAALLSQLRRDVRLLVECQVMDYSLLVGIANMDPRRFDVTTVEAWELSETLENKIRQLSKSQGQHNRKIQSLFRHVMTPLRILAAPAFYIGRRVLAFGDSTLSSILTLPLPYYGAAFCGVNGGSLSVVEGRRSGKRCIYYLGLIDFLQPWTTRKVLERQLKGALGYDIHAISCVSPEEYASRFLEFIEEHTS